MVLDLLAEWLGFAIEAEQIVPKCRCFPSDAVKEKGPASDTPPPLPSIDCSMEVVCHCQSGWLGGRPSFRVPPL